MSQGNFQVHLPAAKNGEDLVLEAPSFHMALVVADINSEGRTAEIYRQDELVATVRRHGQDRMTWWELT